MIRTATIAAFAFAAIAATPAAARSQTDENGTAAASASVKEEKKICKRFEQTASRTRSTKLCLTKADWKKFDDMR